ncbi:magnesium/cobalt transporter CorA [bacterium]|nr:magnesium/cobalt transporter CorA [bacterium]
MARLFRKRVENRNLPPGALVFIGTRKVDQPSIRVFSFSKESVEERVWNREDPLPGVPVSGGSERLWIDVDGLHDPVLIDVLGSHYQIHPLILEDVLNTGQRAKFAEYEDQCFVTVKMLSAEPGTTRVQSEQISFVLKEHLLISFQEQGGDTFGSIRERLRTRHGKTGKNDVDYLLYELLDSIVDGYIYLTEEIGERIDNLEMKLLRKPSERVLSHINVYKQELHFMVKLTRPAVALVRGMNRSVHPLLHKGTRPFLDDLYGLTQHCVESIDSYREVLNDYYNLYHLNVTTRLNEVMRVLTIISTFFAPVTFLAGVYGMNFKYMPEIDERWAYPAFWGVCLAISGGLLVFFRRQRWI